MALGIQWTGSFKSLNDVDCTVNIYTDGGGSAIPITLADDPFYFEENYGDDILNEVIRFRTGYIRVIEQGTYGALSTIYPTGIFDRYVEVLYGNEVVFNGYIQVQDFASRLVPNPRVLELPVISPLGLFEKRTISNTQFLPPTEVSLGNILDVILANSTYEYVYLPKSYGYPNPVSFGMKVSSLVATPWNKDFHHSMNTAPYQKVARGQTYAYIIDAICKAYGWMCHDTPEALVFTAFDYDGTYCYYPVGHIGEAGYSLDANIPDGNLATYFTPTDNDANEQILQPETGIEISYEGESGDRTFTFDRTYVPQQDPVVIMPSFVPSVDVFPNHVEIFSMCSLLPVPNLNEINLVSSPTFDNNDKVNIGNYSVAWNGQEGVMVSIGSYPSDHTLFVLRFYLRRRANQDFSLSYDMRVRKDGAIGGLAANPDPDQDYYITAQLDVSNDDYVAVTFKYRYGGDFPQLSSKALIFISNIKLEVCEDGVPYERYLYKQSDDTDVIPSNAAVNPAISSSIVMPMSLYRLNDNLIGPSVRPTRLTEYAYMFQPRKQLTGRFRVASMVSFPWAGKFNYLGKSWRIIAQTFRPWDDEYTLTMQYSPILNS